MVGVSESKYHESEKIVRKIGHAARCSRGSQNINKGIKLMPFDMIYEKEWETIMSQLMKYYRVYRTSPGTRRIRALSQRPLPFTPSTRAHELRVECILNRFARMAGDYYCVAPKQWTKRARKGKGEETHTYEITTKLLRKHNSSECCTYKSNLQNSNGIHKHLVFVCLHRLSLALFGS